MTATDFISTDCFGPIWKGRECADRLRDDIALSEAPAYTSFYPRRYHEPAGWYSPRIYALNSALAVEAMPRLNVEDNAQLMWEMVCNGHLAASRVPTWWVGEDLFINLLNTAPPAGMLVSDIKWVTPAALFMLPIGATTQAFGRHVAFLGGSLAPVNRAVVLPKDSVGVARELTLASKRPDDCYSLIIQGTMYQLDGRLDGTVSLHCPITPELTVGKILTRDWPAGFSYEDGCPQDTGDADRLDKMVSVFLQLLLLLSMKREAMETGGGLLIGAQTTGKGATKVVHKPSLFAAKWVGKNYVRVKKPPQGGAHASPATHLRPGHWRWQRIGPKLCGVKHIWIEPMWINLE